VTLLTVEAVGCRFGALWAVNHVSFEVAQGEIVGIIGPNGAGKTTLFNMIAGTLTPSTGRIRFSGQKISGEKSYEVARRGVARTFQIPKPFKQLTVQENVMLSALQRHRSLRVAGPLARLSIEFIGLDGLAATPVANLTVGQLKRLEVARALATEPRLILLDEVMAGLTPAEIKEMMIVIGSLPERGITVLWVEHVMMAIMNVAHRVIVLHQGTLIAQGAPAAVTRNPAVIKAYLGESYSYAARV
jgi:branched-chain amino acid transport system ATP-binding protein